MGIPPTITPTPFPPQICDPRRDPHPQSVTPNPIPPKTKNEKSPRFRRLSLVRATGLEPVTSTV